MTRRRNGPADYRVYTRDKDDRIVSVTDLDCGNDKDGLRAARILQESAVRELWQGSRLVAKLDPDGNEIAFGFEDSPAIAGQITGERNDPET